MAKHLLSQLAHVEIITPKLEESANFFKELMGMEELAERASLFTYVAGVITIIIASC